MPFKIIRNDITKMNTEAIVNTANEEPIVGTGCDCAVYQAAGFDKLLSYRKEHIGPVPEGEVFLTPGFLLPANYIIHAVSPLYIDGEHGEEELLRSCYRKSLALAQQKGIRSIAIPLISTGGFGYPKEEGMRIAVDEIHAFLLHSDMQVCLVVFDEKATRMGKSLYPDLEAYIDRHYVEEKREEEYGSEYHQILFGREERPRPKNVAAPAAGAPMPAAKQQMPDALPQKRRRLGRVTKPSLRREEKESIEESSAADEVAEEQISYSILSDASLPEYDGMNMDAEPSYDDEIDEMERKLAARLEHTTDTFSEYLLYLIAEKGMKNADVYKRAIVDKKVFSKIKNNPAYHPQKLTALCLCVGAKLNLDESKDLLARAGYALSPCDKTDIIFSYFIEHEIYDMIELDIQLEEHGQPCIIT